MHTELVERARALAPVVEAGRAQMDAERRLPDAVVQGLQSIGALRMAVPHDLGGPELDPLTQVAVVEELSRLDGSVGWCAMIAAAGSYVSGFLQPEAAARWFGAPDACLAGQLAPTGRAVAVPGGYQVSGRFRFASGSGHATVLIAGCLVYEGDEPSRDDRGRLRMRSALLRPADVRFLDTWYTTGLWGTGSNDYEVDDVFVAEEDSWDPGAAMHRTEPLYRYPPLFLVPHCGVPLGIARTAIDALIELASAKELYPGSSRAKGAKTLADDVQAQETVAIAEAKLGAARAFTYSTVGEVWETLQRGERISPRLRAMYRIMMTYGHQAAKEVVSSLADIATTSAIYRGEPIERQLRDLHTACQHRMVHPKIYVPAGRILLGRDSGDPLV